MIFEEIDQEDEQEKETSDNDVTQTKRFELDNLIIRDATDDEKKELMEMAQESVNSTIMITQQQNQQV